VGNLVGYSSVEFFADKKLVEEFISKASDSEFVFFKGEGAKGLDSIDWNRLIRRPITGHSQLLEACLARRINYRDVGSFLKGVEGLNSSIGSITRSRCGYRNTPLLVWSSDAPWASFTVPDFNPVTRFEECLGAAIDFWVKRKRPEIFIMTICIILVLVHPFVDCNGRTMRVLMHKMLSELTGLNQSQVIFYSSFDRFTKSSFANAFYEFRVDGNFESVFKIFA